MQAASARLGADACKAASGDDMDSVVLRAYHGSLFDGQDRPYECLNPSESGTFGPGVYLASSVIAADIFGGEVEQTKVAVVEVSLANPYLHAIDSDYDTQYIDSWGEQLVFELFKEEDAIKILIDSAVFKDGQLGDEIQDLLQGQYGHDGIIATYSDGASEIVAFDPGVVKIIEWIGREQIDELRQQEQRISAQNLPRSMASAGA